MHIVLVHGECHGAWCWYKVKPLLEAAGYRVTALDMAASGTNPAKIEEVNTLAEYSQPLLSFLACLLPHEKVVLVGHGFGGMNLALAMETFPDKIFVAVFLAAFLPDTEHYPSYVIEEHFERKAKYDTYWMDTKFYPYSSCLNDQNKIACHFGPNFLASECYQLSPIQDLELAKLLVRPSSFLIHDLCKAKYFTSEKYGSVKKVYIVCEQSEVLPTNFQTWMIENYHVDKVFTIEDSDHMAMCSKPEALKDHLFKIAFDDHA